jgi:two-component system chemotaxis response regulator CheB
VLVSGLLDDGVAGLAAVKRAGGICAVQDPEEALFGNMPRAAMDAITVDHVLPLSGLAQILISTTAAPCDDIPRMPRTADPAEMDPSQLAAYEATAVPSEFTCPDCSGTLFETEGGPVPHFRCRVGHAYSIESLDASQEASVENAMWVAIRSLEESVALRRRLAERARSKGYEAVALRYEASIANRNEQAERIRTAIRALSDL